MYFIMFHLVSLSLFSGTIDCFNNNQNLQAVGGGGGGGGGGGCLRKRKEIVFT